MSEMTSIVGMLASELAFGLVYAFLVVRRVNTDTTRITHYEVIIGVSVTLLLLLLWGLIDFRLFALIFAGFAMSGLPMWVEYEWRVMRDGGDGGNHNGAKAV